MFTEKTEYALNKAGFFLNEDGFYLDKTETRKVALKGDGLYAYTVGKGFVDENDDYLEMHLNFIPGEKDGDLNLLVELLKRVFYL
jgi:hypothetical protein